MEYLNLVSILSYIIVQNLPKNSLLRYDMMEFGNLKFTQTLLENKLVSSRPMIVLLYEMSTQILLKWSTMTNKYSWPLRDMEKPPTKSMDKFSQGLLHIGKGMYNPTFLMLGYLVLQITQLLTNPPHVPTSSANTRTSVNLTLSLSHKNI
jgi:hypothetical protein